MKKNPKWFYDPDERGASSRFWRDYHRARRALVYEKRPRLDDGCRQFDDNAREQR